jgi:hypothetical protein
MRLFLQDGPARLQILSRRRAARAACGARPAWSDSELIELLKLYEPGGGG